MDTMYPSTIDSLALTSDTEETFLTIRRPLTYASLAVYGLLFAFIYVQLWLVAKYGYKRWCYRTYVLYVSIVWCILRITLFSYYALMENREAHDYKSSEPCVLSRHVGLLSYFLLFSFPLYLQFTCLCIMVAYFYQIFRSSRNNFHPSELNEWRWPNYTIIAMNVAVFAVNFGSSVIIKWQEDIDPTDLLASHGPVPALPPSLPLLTVWVVHLRVILNGATFMSMASALAYVTVHVANTAEARLLMETENLTQRSGVLVGILLVFLYLCRTVINVLALVPAVSFVLDTDQVDLLSDSHGAYFMFVTVLFLWELLPTVLVVGFFRVKAPPINPVPRPLQVDHSHSQYLVDSISDGSSDEDVRGGGYNNRYSFLYAGSSQQPRNNGPFSSSQPTQPSAGSANSSVTPVACSPNSQYSYEVADSAAPPITSSDIIDSGAVIGRTSDAWIAATNSSGAAIGQYAPLSTNESLQQRANVAPVMDNVHSLSTRFTHRTSLFSYRILNRANRPGAI